MARSDLLRYGSHRNPTLTPPSVGTKSREDEATIRRLIHPTRSSEAYGRLGSFTFDSDSYAGTSHVSLNIFACKIEAKS